MRIESDVGMLTLECLGVITIEKLVLEPLLLRVGYTKKCLDVHIYISVNILVYRLDDVKRGRVIIA